MGLSTTPYGVLRRRRPSQNWSKWHSAVAVAIHQAQTIRMPSHIPNGSSTPQPTERKSFKLSSFQFRSELEENKEKGFDVTPFEYCQHRHPSIKFLILFSFSPFSMILQHLLLNPRCGKHKHINHRVFLQGAFGTERRARNESS